jgi:hypothetical protein
MMSNRCHLRFGGTVSRTAALLALPLAHAAAQKSLAVPADVRTLVAQYVSAFNAKDTARLHALYHPQSLACITPENRAFYDEAMAASFLDPIPPKYTLRLSPVNENNVKALSAVMRFPVKASQEAQIDWQVGEDAGASILWLVRDGGKLSIDWPCATAQALKEYIDDTPAREKRTAENKERAAAIAEPLRSQLITLLRDHKRGEATRRYKEASKVDYPTAVLVINELAHAQR